MRFYHQTLCILIAISLSSCSEDESANTSNPVGDTGWNLPIDQVVDGGVGKDGIIVLVSPSFVTAAEQTYLADEDLVVGYKDGDDIHAYPHRILEWPRTGFQVRQLQRRPGVYNDKLLDEPIVVAGNKSENYMVAYKSTLEDGTLLNFKAVPRNDNIIMEDNAGNQWSIFGEAISGPRSGEKLSPCHAYMSYWFAVGAFFKDAKIFGEKLPEPN